VQSAGGLLLGGLAMVVVLAVAAPTVEGVLLAMMALGALASFEAILPLTAAARHLSQTVEAGTRLFEIVDAQPAVTEPQRPAAPPERFDITIEGLTFRYGPGEPPALQNFSLHIAEGERVAIVGPSGAGKTTLVNLLLRFWDPPAGTVFIGGRDIRDLTTGELRDRIGVVAQDTHLFNDTIRENLLLADPQAAPHQVEAAARAAQVHEFIAGLPQGYDTLAGEQGAQLSGGERQRIALARALLKDTPILLRDAPTADLDAITERALLSDLEAAAAGRTMLIITHRPTALAYVDRVVRLG
ncbi:MAG: ABC transporter ATP-binding protein, partial [Chloroflexi bacterium]|nr:ABC transporter ATP-binding protein [Chloroflexota bacterium]